MRYLLAASVGPVQSFIVAARKTRDLYAGSWILSEVAKAAAANLKEANAALIFPWCDGDLNPGSAFTVSNKILAVVDVESPSGLARGTRDAARLRLRNLCENLRKNPPKHCGTRLLEHVEELLEFYAAWVPYPDGAEYQPLYGEVEALLNARKMTKIFPRHAGIAGKLKSSLDGTRESILPEKEDRIETDQLDSDEELDGTGFLKRFVNVDGVRFDSVTDLARSPYRGCKPEAGADLYYAILMADGDSMGERIGALARPQQEAISRRLSNFAQTVREILKELGCMPVFAGGDELIAMIPLHQLFQALHALRTTFQDIVGASGKQFTISAGVAIVHEKEPLDEARVMANVAKKQAKELPDKDGLCIVEAPRSGTPVSVVAEWDWILPRLDEVSKAYMERKLSYGFGHELWDVLKRTPEALEDVRPDMAVALAKHKTESAAAGLVEANKGRLEDLLGVLFVTRKPAQMRIRWDENQPGEKA